MEKRNGICAPSAFFLLVELVVKVTQERERGLGGSFGIHISQALELELCPTAPRFAPPRPAYLRSDGG